MLNFYYAFLLDSTIYFWSEHVAPRDNGLYALDFNEYACMSFIFSNMQGDNYLFGLFKDLIPL